MAATFDNNRIWVADFSDCYRSGFPFFSSCKHIKNKIMNKQILFRGKSIQTCEWIYGGYYFWNGETFIIPYDRFAGDEYFSEALEDYCVETETVGQFLGIVDKNGKEIYEGDIIIDETNRKGTVIFYNGCFSFITEFLSIMKVIDKISTVIGNIYDNPEKVIS